MRCAGRPEVRSALPKVLEPVGCRVGVPDGVLNALVPEIVLQGTSIMAIVGELEPTGMVQHVRVDREWHLGSLVDALDEAVETDRAHWPPAFGNEDVSVPGVSWSRRDARSGHACGHSPAEGVLYCVDTDIAGFIWDKQGKVRTADFVLSRFTVKIGPAEVIRTHGNQPPVKLTLFSEDERLITQTSEGEDQNWPGVYQCDKECRLEPLPPHFLSGIWGSRVGGTDATDHLYHL